MTGRIELVTGMVLASVYLFGQAATRPACAAEEPSGWISLFDGQDLQDWTGRATGAPAVGRRRVEWLSTRVMPRDLRSNPVTAS